MSSDQIRELLAQAEFTPSVVGYLVQDGKVLLGLRKKVSLGLGENLVSGIGGKVGDEAEFADETSDEALIREFAEEIQVKLQHFVNRGRVRFIFPNKPKWNHEVAIYVIDAWDGEPQETDAIKPQWYPQAELPAAQMWQDNPIWLPQVLAGGTIDAVFVYNEDNATIAMHSFEV